MRVVVDTNIVVSAILPDRLPEKVLLFIIGHPEIEWVASKEILAEYREVLRRPKFALPEVVLLRWDWKLNWKTRAVSPRRKRERRLKLSSD